MTITMNRRDFIRYAGGGLAVLAVGSRLQGIVKAAGFDALAVQTLDFHITDAIKEMVTHNAINTAECYFWIYKSASPDLPADCPGPIIFATQGDTIRITLTNDLDEPHSFTIPGIFDSGPIPADGVPRNFSFIVPATKSGGFLYFDSLNSPVNRVMGLHGAFIVMPRAARLGHKFTPYHDPAPPVQLLFDHFGSSAHFPGLSWQQGDPANNTPPFRRYIWLTHQASPVLFEEVGSLPEGEIMPAAAFVEAFLRDPFSQDPNGSRLAQYFTINGQSGHFSHNSPFITPMGRVGEPAVVHILNAGLWTHSMHLHANHFYVTSINGVVQSNPLSLDTFEVQPMDRTDYVIAFTRPPDIPNEGGIGMPDTPLNRISGGPCYPPDEEFATVLPVSANGPPLTSPLAPLCYPMHDHSEPSQTSQGGNYNQGLIAGIYYVGDRNTPGAMDFPMDPEFEGMFRNIRGISGTGPAAPGEPRPDFPQGSGQGLPLVSHSHHVHHE